jgi:chromodomain-helicase-DNA-binding protein 7
MNRKASNSSFQDDLDFLDEEDEQYEDSAAAQNDPDNSLVVEKILGRKFSLNEETQQMEELYFIKWKNFSYLHVSWERREDVEEVDPNGKSKIKRFLLSPLPGNILGEIQSSPSAVPKIEGLEGEEIVDFAAGDDDDIEYFNPEMIEVQRIISCDTPDAIHAKARKPEDLLKEKPSRKRKNDAESTDDGGDENGSQNGPNEIKYFVKWRGSSYAECSWERFEDIKGYYPEVWLFWQLQKPPKLPLPGNSSPSLQEYKKLEVSPRFGLSKLFPEEIQYDEGLKLRDYQLEGVNWLLWNWWHKRSCILADEM